MRFSTNRISASVLDPTTWFGAGRTKRSANSLMAAGSSVGSASMRLALYSTRRLIAAAAKQLNAARGVGLPLAIVLADAEGFGHQIGANEVIWAMYGDPEVHVPVGPERPRSEPRYTLGRDGALRGQNTSISAVATIHKGDRGRESLSAEVRRRVGRVACHSHD